MSRIRLFISHSERDEPLIRPMYNWLQSGLGLDKDDIRCTSIDNITAGGAAIDKLRDDLEAADAIVGLITSNSLRSHWVAMELGASWLKERLFPVRGPGVTPQDLPAPLPNFTTVGYCEKHGMSQLLQDLASLLQLSVNGQAKFDLDTMVQIAEDYMRCQIRGWFELPALLSAWRLNEEDFVAPLLSALKRLEIDDSQEVRECAEPTGLVLRDPEFLPTWARNHWQLSKLTVNHLLTGTGEFVDIPHSILDERLTADLRRAWSTSSPRRGRMLCEWMQHAGDHVAENLPVEARGH